MLWLFLVLILKFDTLSSSLMRILQHIKNIIFQRESCEQDCWEMVVCRSEAKMFGKMVRMIAMSDYRAVMLTFCQKKHSGTRAIFNFFRAIDNSNFYWKILSRGHFFQVVQMLFSFVFFNTLQNLFAAMIPWIVLQRNQGI